MASSAADHTTRTPRVPPLMNKILCSRAMAHERALEPYVLSILHITTYVSNWSYRHISHRVPTPCLLSARMHGRHMSTSLYFERHSSARVTPLAATSDHGAHGLTRARPQAHELCAADVCRVALALTLPATTSSSTKVGSGISGRQLDSGSGRGRHCQQWPVRAQETHTAVSTCTQRVRGTG